MEHTDSRTTHIDALFFRTARKTDWYCGTHGLYAGISFSVNWVL